MSVLEENPSVKMNSEDEERDEPQCCSEDSSGTALRPSSSLTSMSSGSSWSRADPTAPVKYIICDRDQKVLILDSEVLKAVARKVDTKPEIFFLLSCNLKSSNPNCGTPIFLAVSKGKLSLCCVKGRGRRRPCLQLKKKTLKQLADQKENKVLPFIFYRTEEGGFNSLESAAHPGWFICTDQLCDPVGMTKCTGQKEITQFLFESPPSGKESK